MIFSAIANGRISVAEKLIEQEDFGALNFIDAQGNTPLIWSAVHGAEEIADILIKSGLVKLDVGDNEGYTALHYAAQNGYYGIVESLVCCGARLAPVANDGQCPLDLAVAKKHEGIIDLLYDSVAQTRG